MMFPLSHSALFTGGIFSFGLIGGALVLFSLRLRRLVETRKTVLAGILAPRTNTCAESLKIQMPCPEGAEGIGDRVYARRGGRC